MKPCFNTICKMEVNGECVRGLEAWDDIVCRLAQKNKLEPYHNTLPSIPAGGWWKQIRHRRGMIRLNKGQYIYI